MPLRRKKFAASLIQAYLFYCRSNLSSMKYSCIKMSYSAPHTDYFGPQIWFLPHINLFKFNIIKNIKNIFMQYNINNS